MKTGFGILPLIFGIILTIPSATFAISKESATDQARRLYHRLAGIPPSPAEMNEMIALLEEGKTNEAALVAIDATNLNFYKSTLHNMFSPFTNPNEDTNIPLNDVTASVAGLIINNEPFDQVLYGDFLYVARPELSTYTDTENTPVNAAGPQGFLIQADGDRRDNRVPDGRVIPLIDGRDENRGNRYLDNDHYEMLENLDLDGDGFSEWPANLTKVTQSEIYSVLRDDGPTSRRNAVVPEQDIAGLLTTRAMGEYNFLDGTNRRFVATTFNNFLCRSIHDLHDTSADVRYIRQDVDRAPGGDAREFKSICAGCHAGLDSLASAGAYFDFDDSDGDYLRHQLLEGTSNLQDMDYRNEGDYRSNPKRGIYKMFNQDGVYPQGSHVINNSWVNLWTKGPNADLGWRSPASTLSQSVNQSSTDRGIGMASLMMVLASTEAFGNCMAKRAFKRVCFREPTPEEVERLDSIARTFDDSDGDGKGFVELASHNADGPYNMRGLFAEVSSMCFGN